MNPKLYIDTEEELLELGKEWKDRLLLNNWIICFRLQSVRDMKEIEWCGESNVQWVNRCGTVSLLRKEDMPQTIAKQPMELTLIHELLHFKFMSFDGPSLEGVYWVRNNISF